jgi:hypothetical protein
VTARQRMRRVQPRFRGCSDGPAASTIPSFFMSHFNAVEWRAQRSPACSHPVAQLAGPAGVVTWQAHEQQGESRRIEVCQPEVMCQLKMRGFKSPHTHCGWCPKIACQVPVMSSGTMMMSHGRTPPTKTTSDARTDFRRGEPGRRSAIHVRREKAAHFQWVQAPPGKSLQPEATGAGMEVTKCLKPSDNGRTVGDRASVQAATRVNAEQSSKRTR